MNKVHLYGRVSQISELRYTNSNIAVINFSVATGFGDRVTFVPVTAWAKQAELVSNFLGKGNRVLVEGRITSNKNVRNDVEYTEHKVTADFVEFVETKAEKDGVKPEDFEVEQPEPKDNDADLPF